MTDRLAPPPGTGAFEAPDNPRTPDRRLPPPAPPFRVVLRSPTPAALVAEVHGELDLATASPLQTRLGHVLAGTEHTVLVMDVSNVRFLSATGISALLCVREYAHRRGIAFRLVATHSPVLRPLSLLGLTATLDIHPSRERALAPPTPHAGDGHLQREEPRDSDGARPGPGHDVPLRDQEARPTARGRCDRGPGT